MMSWNGVILEILAKQAHEDVTISKSSIPHPSNEGFQATSLAENQGEKTNYRKALGDGRGIHIREFDGHYKIHWDMFDPMIQPLEHLRYDAPQWWLVATTLAGGIVGAIADKNHLRGAIVGGLTGLSIGIMTLPSENNNQEG